MSITQQALEEAVLATLCYNQKAPEIALRLQDSKLFSGRTNQTIAKVCLDYIDKYSTCPNGHLELLLETAMLRGEEGKLIRQEITNLAKLSVNLDTQFVTDELDKFIELQKLRKVIENAEELVHQGDLVQAKEVLFSSTITNHTKSTAINLFDPTQSLRFLNKDQERDWFSSGIQHLDLHHARPGRKKLMFIIASSGKGKSWWLTDVGKAAIQHHHKVVHITLELTEEEVAERYIQSIFSYTQREAQILQTRFFDVQPDGSILLDIRSLERDSIVNRKKEVAAKLAAMGTNHAPFIINHFPANSLSTQQLCLYLDELERTKNFKPDLLIIDYADLMRIDSSDLRIDTGRLYKDLKGIASARDIAIVTASQGNRISADAKLVTDTNVAEDWSKIGTADIVLTYSQTPEENKRGLARLFVSKNRGAKDKYIVLISQAYDIGQFCLDSAGFSLDLMNQVKALTEQEIV